MMPTAELPASLADQTDRDPYPFYAEIQARGRAVWDEGAQSWLVFGYDDAEYVMKHEELFLAPWTLMNLNHIFGNRSLFGLTGEPHRKMYAEVLNFFSPRVVRQLQTEVIRPLVAERIDRFAGHGRAELAAGLADEIPVRVIGAMLDLDWREEEFAGRCWRLTDAFLTMTGDFFVPGRAEDSIQAANESVAELDSVIEPALDGAAPDSYIGRLWRAGAEIFDDWGRYDVLESCRFLFIAGMHTTSHLICNATWMLLQHRQLIERLNQAEDRKRLLERFVEEALRLYPPLQFRFRIAAEDLDFAGATIKAGDKVVASAGAANREPERYECPAEISLERRPGHLSFNAGPRFCSGSRLARVEAYDTLDGILRRLPDLTLDAGAAPPRFAGVNQRSYRPLHVTFRPDPA